MERQKKLLIVEDHEIIVWALRTLIEDSFPQISVFTAPTFEAGLAILDKQRISFVVLDIDVPGGNSPKMIEQIRAIRPSARILIHTAMPEEDYALRYLSAGADGFISKSAPLGALPSALQMTLEGRKYVSEATKQVLAESFLNDFDKKRYDPELLFSKRERQIAKLLLKGKWTKEISDELGIRLSTVSTHKLAIFDKMQVGNVVDLYRKVQKEMPEFLRGV
ncbi:two component transcriptional regulator, LuxR family [Dyadobacter soli]|uniref:Two component transcriptional regulator, LuxR family n=2 Tax=Dyadobacter soli TaxID=659014 RepID=A0A1G7NC45_9BACT|nr:two component transcriptional regulator, LuxR family [Dyadobacter soli]